MTGTAKLVFLAPRLLDDLRMIPRAYDLLERIEANARAFGAVADLELAAGLSCAWSPLAVSAIEFCERLAARYDGVVLEEDFDDLDLMDVDFSDDDIDALKLFGRDPCYAPIVSETLEIIRQCRHIQSLLQAEGERAAA